MESSYYMIHLLNVKDGEMLSYSLPLLKGQIVSSNKEPVYGNISVQICDKIMEWPVTANQFKVLLPLSKDLNKIILTYEKCEVILNLKFKPNDNGYYVIPVYIVSFDHDGQFQGPESSDCSISSARYRIAFATRLLQSILAEKLNEFGLGRRTFPLMEGEKCLVHESPLSLKKAQNMKQEELWEYYGRELVNTFGIEKSKNYKFLAFLACTHYEGGNKKSGMTYEEILSRTKGHVALGGGGLAIFGTGCLHTWPSNEAEVSPFLNSLIPVDQTKFMDDSCYRGTYGGCLATTLGSVLHELCHTFDLGHTDKGIMGRGFDHINLVLGEEEEATTDVNSNSHAIHSTVNFTVNLKVDCVMEKSSNPVGLQTSCSKQSRGSRMVPSSSTDRTFFTKSCAFLLAYHRWFNNVHNKKECYMTFDERSWTLRASSGLRVVEVREGERQVVRASWCFPQSRQLFVVPRSTLPSMLHPPLLLLAEDSVGNILRHNLSLS